MAVWEREGEDKAILERGVWREPDRKEAGEKSSAASGE
jgi:hypothetical protein